MCSEWTFIISDRLGQGRTEIRRCEGDGVVSCICLGEEHFRQRESECRGPERGMCLKVWRKSRVKLQKSDLKGFHDSLYAGLRMDI